jgi:cardiolipin synthase
MRASSEAAAPAVSKRLLTLPNVLSLARLLSVPVFVWLFIAGHTDAAVVLYAVAAWTDFFDGFLARRTGSVTELGMLLDPLADRVFIVALAVALVARDALPWWLTVAVVARDVALVSAYPFIDRRVASRIPVSFVGKTATAALLVGLTLLAWGETSFPGAGITDEPGLWSTVVGALLYYVAGVMYAREAMTRMTDRRDQGS